MGYAPSEEQKELFYNLAVEKIQERTSGGKDIDNRKFTRYSKGYADKKGVSRSSVDLILTGEMLTSFDESTTRDKVILKINESNTGKAHGNITGSYGRPSGDSSKARDFFGFKNEKQIKDVIQTVDSAKESSTSSFDLAALRAAISDLDIDFGDFNGDN